VSAEAIRWGLREYLQNAHAEATNRTFNPDKDEYNFKDEKFSAKKFIDDDLFGFMDAKKGKDNENATTKRRGALEVSRALSLDPYWGDVALAPRVERKIKPLFTAPKFTAPLINTRSHSHLKAFRMLLALHYYWMPFLPYDTLAAIMLAFSMTFVQNRSSFGSLKIPVLGLWIVLSVWVIRLDAHA
jgi:hypothetical protein